MKAFVIKNKEEKYWQFLYNDESEFVDEIYNAFMHYSREDAKKDIYIWGLKDCKVVEITIAEGDLSQKIGELKDYIYYYNNETNNREQTCNEYIDATCKDILEKMKELKL